MISRIFALILLITPLAASNSWPQEESLSSIIDDYEVFRHLNDPVLAARAENRAPDAWRKVTPDAVSSRAETANTLLERLDQLNSQHDQASEAILRHLLQADLDADTHDTARTPLNSDWGFFSEPYAAAYTVRLESVEAAEAWIRRLQDVSRYFDESIQNMERGLATGWVSHQDPVQTSLTQLRKHIVDDPADSALFEPFEALPDTLTVSERKQIRDKGLEAVDEANEAARRLLVFLEDTYVEAARKVPGLSSLPGGSDAYEAALAYHTAGAGLSAEEIHALGQAEVTRILAEMEAILGEVGFEGTRAEFIEFLRTDPQFYAETPEDLLQTASEIAKRLDGILPRYFETLPRMPYTIVPVPPAIAPGYTTGRYSGGDALVGRPGRYLLNTYRLSQRPLYELPALTAHEAVPGHHLQIALAQELTDVPEFRKSYYATAFGEGWGLYAEKLAGEAGIYRTPYERFGQLSYEMWRACRLVADTGLHHYGWSRAEARTCFEENTALSAHNIETELTRYIGWPGQATAYKIGELKILELRHMAEVRLGEAFDIRAFHDHLLGAGTMPLNALEKRMTRWVEEQL